MSREAEPDAAGVEPPDWERLYAEMGEKVFRMIHRMTGDEHLAEDLTHDTFVRMHERRHQYDGRGSVEGWVFQIARNLTLNRARIRSNRRRLLEREAPRLDRHPTPGSRTSVESRLQLESALDELPSGQRTALLLHVVDGYTHAEIGRMLQIAEGTSRARVSRAKAALRDAKRSANHE